MVYSTRFGLLLLIATAFCEIYFEEDFEDDSWRERWVTSAYYRRILGKFDRSTVVFYGGANNTGLRTTEAGKDYILSTRLDPITIEYETFVMQFSVKYGHTHGCDFGYINLYDCNVSLLNMSWNTPYVLKFGPVGCRRNRFGLRAENLWGQSIESFVELPLDKHMHVYTLILRPSRSYEIIFDDGTVYRKNASLVENQIRLQEQNTSRNIATMHPNVCGIGFKFSHRKGGTIFDNILLANDVAVAKSKRDHILAEASRWKLGGTSILVDISAADLTKILHCKRNSQVRKDNHTRPIFEDFDKFLVPFNWNDNNTVIMTTVEYNRLRGAYNVSIQLWVSVEPQQDDILDDIDSVLKVVNEANSVASKTVTTIVISYGFLKLNEETLPFINHEIRKVNKKIKSLPVQPLDIGLQLSDINCLSNRHYAQYLETNLLDFLVFMPMPQTNKNHRRDSIKMISSCAVSANLMDIAVAPLIHSYESVEIDFEKEVYNYNKTFAQKYNNIYLHALALIRAGDKIRSEETRDTDLVPKSKNLANWIYQPTSFSKSHLGAIISWTDIKLMGLENFTKIILERFRHVMIDISTHDDFETEDSLEPIMKEIALYSSLLMKKQDGIGKHIPKDNTQLRMSILVTILTNDFDVNKRQADRAISAARKCNEISPGSVEIIFFDLLACSRSEICSGHNQYGLEIVCLHAERVGKLSKILNYAVFPLYGNLKEEETIVSLGRVEDRWVDELKLEYENKKCAAKNQFYSFNQANNLLCKSIVRHEDVVNYGGLKASDIVIESFSFCAYFGKTDEFLFINFYVNVVGCVGGHSNLTLLVEYAILMENLHRWAEIDGIFLFINAGVEPSKCNGNTEGCDCGWWIKQDSNDSYQDKKLVARQLYEKAKADEERTKRHVPKESLLWLWILIPVIVFGALIIIPAVFLVFHYRSKYILTKREVEEFIKGRQETRGEQVRDGDEVAGTQSYNSQKYELSPSTFTIDITSTCLGSGEYGSVYPGSIRHHDGDIIEAAVKMTNTNLVQKSHGYYLALKGLLSEIKILAYVGEHNHVVSLLGAYTKKARKGEIAVFLELCQLGSLDKYLHTIKPQLIDNCVDSNNETSEPDANYVDEEQNERRQIQKLDEESSQELFRWSGEIASGMEFLASTKLVHADLATRNVLLTINKVAKISDFGLSRRLYEYTEYVKKSQGALPWRWMAPESLCRSIFNEKTDIWAFGVTLWEMFTLGDQPYPGLTWIANFPLLLERGLRLPEPRFNMKQIYLLMLRCWDVSPALRPTFAQLKSELNPV